MRERDYQAYLIRKLHDLIPGCVVLKNDSGYRQGIPDLALFCGPFWAWLEVKTSADAPSGPNQEFYIELASKMSFGAFIYPENERYVLDEIQRAFRSCGQTRIS